MSDLESGALLNMDGILHLIVIISFKLHDSCFQLILTALCYVGYLLLVNWR